MKVFWSKNRKRSISLCGFIRRRSIWTNITVFNAGKKREEALKALTLWLPEAERFTAQMKETQNYINQLVDTSATLSKKLSEKEERYTELSMEAAYMVIR